MRATQKNTAHLSPNKASFANNMRVEVRACVFTEIKTLALVYLKNIKIEIIMSQNNYTTRIIILQGVFQK